MWVEDIQVQARELNVDAESLVQEVTRLLPDEDISDDDLFDLIARTASSHALKHHHYGLLGGRMFALQLQRSVGLSFSENIRRLHAHQDRSGPSPLVSDDLMAMVDSHGDELNAAVRPERDFDLTYFGLRTLHRTYFLRDAMSGAVLETPQYLFMRVALGICGGDVETAIQTYDDMSSRLYTHATPTLFNSGTCRPQLSSCFLLQMQEDSIDGIMNTLKQCAKISKHAGGIGLSLHNIRAQGSRIRGTNGTSNGLVPLHRVLNQLSLYVDQGGGKRKGSIACYLEPWHADIEDWIQLRLPVGSEEARARDLFYALWIPDLFMKRVQNNEPWTLMCPDQCPGLDECWGDKFEELYTRYEREGRGVRTIKSQDLWFRILTSQVETGLPYMLYKDACNRKSNQQHLGTIKSSNLCTEIVEYTSPEEVAVCNLASICLPQYVCDGQFDFQLLEKIVRRATRNLDRVIDVNYYPLPEARYSNEKHRPVGLGVQGLADVFQRMGLPYDSDEALRLDSHIFETIYYAAVSESCEIAKEKGVYPSFAGSPASEGRLQFDLWDKTEEVYASGRIGREKWEALKAEVVEHGLRNSLLTAPMPTASTSQIMGSFTQAFHPIPSLLYQRRTQSGDFMLCCPAFIDAMDKKGLWNKEAQEAVLRAQGRIDDPALASIVPDDLRNCTRACGRPRSGWLTTPSRAPFIDQSQSLELWVEKPTTKILTSMHFYSWRKGLKTGLYYLRSRAKTHSINFSVTNNTNTDTNTTECLSCGS